MTTETLKNLKAAKADLTGHLASLEKERESVRADIQALDRIIARYESGEQGLFGDESRSAIGKEFKGATMRKSVLTILKRAYPDSMKAREIAQAIINGGYETDKNAIDLSNAIFANLSYLTGKTKEVEKLGEGNYKIKGEFATTQ